MIRALVLLLLAAMATTACLEDPEFDDQAFPCRSAEDCVTDFECHPERFVCVPVEGAAAVDAGQLDAS